MSEITWASAGAAVLKGVFAVVDTLKAAYEASHKWFAVGCGIFVLLVWFGYAHLPTFSSKDATLEKQVAELTKSLDDISTKLDGLASKKDVDALVSKKKLK